MSVDLGCLRIVVVSAPLHVNANAPGLILILSPTTNVCVPMLSTITPDVGVYAAL